MLLFFLFHLLIPQSAHAEDLDDQRAALQAQIDAVDEQIATRDSSEVVERALRPIGTIIDGVTGAGVDRLIDFVNVNGAAWASECLTDVAGAPFAVTFSLTAGMPTGFHVRATNTTVDEETRSCLASTVKQSVESQASMPRAGKVTFLIQ